MNPNMLLQLLMGGMGGQMGDGPPQPPANGMPPIPGGTGIFPGGPPGGGMMSPGMGPMGPPPMGPPPGMMPPPGLGPPGMGGGGMEQEGAMDPEVMKMMEQLGLLPPGMGQQQNPLIAALTTGSGGRAGSSGAMMGNY